MKLLQRIFIKFILFLELNCNENEVPNWCPERCLFDMTCNRLIDGIIPPCLPPNIPHICEPRCYCKPGLVRENGICVPDTTCQYFLIIVIFFSAFLFKTSYHFRLWEI